MSDSLRPVVCSTLGFSVLLYLQEFAQTHVHWVGDAIQPSHSLLPSSPPALNLSQHQGLFQWVSSSHQVVKVLNLQLQSFQWVFRVDFLEVKGTLNSLLQHHSSKASVLQRSVFFMVQLSHLHVTTEKSIALTIQTLSAKQCLHFLICCLVLS